MSAALRMDWTAPFESRIRFSEPMSRHTSWHVGGPADVFFVPKDAVDLESFLSAAPAQTDIVWMGLGSNVLVRDGGIRGAVVCLHGALNTLTRLSENVVHVEAGVPCARLARQCVKWGLGPAEFFAGIPGTVGGALAMNAGAFGGETWTHVLEVDTVARDGARRTRTPADFRIGYRSVEHLRLEPSVRALSEGFIAARLRFEAKPEAHGDAIRDLLAQRRATQPIGEWSCGSVFANPPGDHAARLIEAAYLKGFRRGDASVSMKHANFIVNHGAARAADLEAVILHVQATLLKLFGMQLRPEVRIIGSAQ